MSFPNIPNMTPAISISVGQTVPLLLASIALEELSLAHIMNAEAEKLQFILGTLDGTGVTFSPPEVSVGDLRDVNVSVVRTLRDVIKKEMLLEFKFENVLDLISTLPTPPTHILAIGGELNGSAISNVDIFFCEQNTWQTRAPLLEPLDALAGGLMPNGKVIVSHGFTPAPFTATNRAEFFDPATNTWTFAPSANVARGSLGGDVLNGIFYAVGGNTGLAPADQLATVEAFNGTAWSMVQSLPSAKSELAVVSLNGLLHAIGGFDGTSELANHDAYDPTTNLWSPRAPLPQPRAFPSAAVFNEKIYVFGGRVSGTATNTVFIYDPTTDTWSTGASMPTSRWGTAACVCDSEIFVMGGFNPNLSPSYLNIVEAYNPVTNTWRTNVAPMPTARALFPCVSV
ncbi:Kelch repeat-containing protein [Ectobacillus sp. sgz5001026]|uniref:Kelch repeat-containing protein n=1 Tax=Ectobacillus sp. sgz5001026 TaxID=3242473 RepID=UPI0036D2D1F7